MKAARHNPLLPALSRWSAAVVTTVIVGSAAAAARDDGERVTWNSVHCSGAPAQCKPMTAVGFFHSAPGATRAVTVSHGTQGLDANVFRNYVDPLVDAGLAVLVIDHYTPRAMGKISADQIRGSAAGGNVFNVALDVLTAADWLRRDRGMVPVGSLGESSGGAAMLWLDKKFMVVDWVEATVRRTLRTWFSARPVEALVALYPFCGVRDEGRDRYFEHPLLIVSGELDDATPAAQCERLDPWMRERGARVEMVTLPGHAHNFDFAHPLAFGPSNVNPAKCDIVIDRGGTVTDLPTGSSARGFDLGAVMARCSTLGYHGGHNGNPRVAVPLWTAFFAKHL